MDLLMKSSLRIANLNKYEYEGMEISGALVSATCAFIAVSEGQQN